MSEVHLTQGVTSSDLVLRPKINIDKSRSDPHHGRPWIRTGLARLPPELIHLVCRRLCLCWYCQPRLDPLDESSHGLVQFRNALDSLSKTCNFLCAVAQPYLFHTFRGASQDLVERSRDCYTLFIEFPHLASQVRRMTFNSMPAALFFLRRLTGLWTLRITATGEGGIGPESYLSLQCLLEFRYGPLLDSKSKVSIENASKDMRAILTAAPSLSHLRCHRLFESYSLSPFVLPELPACHITTLELHQCWLPHGTLIRFIANFPRLKFFRLEKTMPSHLASQSRRYHAYPSDGPQRLADGTDGESPSCERLKVCS